VLASDDPLLEEPAKKLGAFFMLRTPEFCDEVSKTPNDMIKDILGRLGTTVDQDIVLWAHCTNPFTDAVDYDAALSMFPVYQREGFDSIASVNARYGHFWSSDLKTVPLNFNPDGAVHELAKNLPPILEQNGAIFIRKHKDMLADGKFIGGTPKLLALEGYAGLDINEKPDLLFAMCLLEVGYVK
jgi:CMP-N-acetylneuraminic acid synthetase